MGVQEFILSNPGISIIIIAFVVSLITILVTKFFTNQKELRRIREETKKLQVEMKKELKRNPTKAQAIQKQIMQLSMQSMRHSFRVTLITIIPLLLIFGWMRSNLAYHPLQPDTPVEILLELRDIAYTNISLTVIDQNFTEKKYTPFIEADRKHAKFLVKFPHYGEYALRVDILGVIDNSTEVLDTATKTVIVDQYKYSQPISSYKNKYIKKIEVVHESLHPLGDFNILGWYPGWFAIYFTSSIIFLLGLKKLLKVY
ncbi:DUF106 domain-containing protein [Candidatus Woesearchaeota archaeon]|nr:DUF106 domain-containing protein [Candidatus Woesearchaeota archaeon]